MGAYKCKGGVTTMASAMATIRQAHLGISPEALFPSTPKPKDATGARWILCFGPGPMIMNRYWVTPGTVTLEQRARVALTRLPFPKVSVAYSVGGDKYDADITYVNTPTYWWVKGAAQVEIRSPDAAGLVAHAKPLNVAVNPGDGSPAKVCAWETGNGNNSSSCQHVYEKTSLYEGSQVYTINVGPNAGTQVKAYQASMTPQWEIWFTLGGTRIPIPGLPTTQNSVTVTANVPVDEIQSLAGP
ncbi:MAG: hypothetical protein ACRC0L_08255, partial [Angustibacter sp.]